MKQVLLLGDSIRLGYCGPVREKLKTVAEVYFPEDNCRYTQYTFVQLRDWTNLAKTPQEVDVVHWNNGHWDSAHWDGDTEPLNSLEAYGKMLERIHARLAKYCPRAKIIFALTTPMNPNGSQGANPRTTEQIAGYNETARKLMGRLGVPVNDLFSVMKDQPPAMYIDSVHYTEAGYARLAEVVAGVIRQHL